ncbi:MAG: hypothetical protein PHR26_01890 [Candidatus ainarchaeum sp.]|nr:hypothetical protein [Candidatus ainarchaeum sp.]MDD3975632.1 hypothetical protein [Candidatus ainarchaeum sp.]
MVKKKKSLVNDFREPTRLSPKCLMNKFYESVSLKTAIVVIIISVLIESIIFMVYGISSIKYFLLQLLDNLVFNWLITGVILFVLLYLIKGKNNVEKNSLKKILSGLASFKIIHIISTLLSFLVVVIFSPNLITFLKSVIVNPLNAYSSTALSLSGFGTIISFILLFIIGVFLIYYLIALIYHLVRNMFKYKNIEINIILTIVVFVVLYLINLVF